MRWRGVLSFIFVGGGIVAGCGQRAPLGPSPGTAGESQTDTGDAGTGGRTSVGGPAGAGGATGAVGSSGAGGSAGAATGQGGAAGTAPAVCVEGTTSCAGTNTTQICMGGIWQPAFSCPIGCLDGVCTECMPGTATCVSATQIERCSNAGIYGAPTPCATSCLNGACASNPRTVFVTSQTFMGGGLNGLAGADVICQQSAVAANLGGTYLAWLSDSTGSPSTRFLRSPEPYVLVDGTVVANGWPDLTSGMLRHAIDMTEAGEPRPLTPIGCGGPTVWSDTSSDGTQLDALASCGDWMDTAANAAYLGLVGSTTLWSQVCREQGTGVCGSMAALYCFEQ